MLVSTVTQHRHPRSRVRDTRILAALFLLSAVTLGLLGSLVTNAEREGIECVESRDCLGPGQLCSDGICISIAAPELLSCRVNDRCDADCELGGDLHCVNGLYARVSGPKICTDQQALDFLGAILNECGDIGQCTTEQLRDVVLGTEDFDRLIANFDSAFAVHFDYGRPRAWDRSGKSTTWRRRRAYYVGRIRSRVSILTGPERAKTVLLIATSSATKRGSTRNDELALRRVNEVREMLNEAVGIERAAEDQGSGAGEDFTRIKYTSLSDSWQLDEARYEAFKLHSSVLWDGPSERRFLGLMDTAEGGARALKWRDDVVNQTVYVIPIPCEVGH